jgi:hypothetical protein
MADDVLAPSSGSKDHRPVPDPTTLTTQALYREIAQLREFISAGIDGDNKQTVERFAKVDQQFELIERTRVELRIADQTALAAALAAQKESAREQAVAFERATAKAEAATTKQLEQLTINFTTATAGQTAIINDMKDRIGRIESVKAGGKEAISNVQMLLALVVVLITIGGFMASLGN